MKNETDPVFCLENSSIRMPILRAGFGNILIVIMFVSMLVAHKIFLTLGFPDVFIYLAWIAIVLFVGTRYLRHVSRLLIFPDKIVIENPVTEYHFQNSDILNIEILPDRLTKFIDLIITTDGMGRKNFSLAVAKGLSLGDGKFGGKVKQIEGAFLAVGMPYTVR